MKIHSFCCDCGINVRIDEDGCCVTCGATADGEALSEISPRVEVIELRRRIRLARKAFYACKFVAEFGTTNIDVACAFVDLLDLRKPLKAGRR